MGYLYILNRYEEVEVRKKLEEKEKQDEKKRKEEISEKDDSPKASASSRKDSKKVAMFKNLCALRTLHSVLEYSRHVSKI